MKLVDTTYNIVQRHKFINPEMMQICWTRLCNEENSAVMKSMCRRNAASVKMNVPVIKSCVGRTINTQVLQTFTGQTVIDGDFCRLTEVDLSTTTTTCNRLLNSFNADIPK